MKRFTSLSLAAASLVFCALLAVQPEPALFMA